MEHAVFLCVRRNKVVNSCINRNVLGVKVNVPQFVLLKDERGAVLPLSCIRTETMLNLSLLWFVDITGLVHTRAHSST